MRTCRGFTIRRASLLVLATLCIIFSSCTRSVFTIGDVHFHPVVVASHHLGHGVSTISEGIGLLVFADPLEEDAVYQVIVTEPSGNRYWEFSTVPVSVAAVQALVKTDLLLPPDRKLESGIYQVEVFLPDGRRFETPFTLQRPSHELDRVLAIVAAFDPPVWIDGSAFLRGVSDVSTLPWTYVFYDIDGTELVRLESDEETIPTLQAVREQASLVIAMRLDEASGIRLVVRADLT